MHYLNRSEIAGTLTMFRSPLQNKWEWSTGGAYYEHAGALRDMISESPDANSGPDRHGTDGFF